MRWQALFDDLEARALALERDERLGEVAERTRGEVGALSVADRMAAAVGCPVRVRSPAGLVTGVLSRAGPDWLLVDEDGGAEAVLAARHVLGVRGVPRYSAAPGTVGLVASRLGLRSVLRGLARDRSPVRLHLADGSVVDATIDRIGADFVEVAAHAAAEPRRRQAVRDVELIPLPAVAVVRRRL